MRDKKLTRILIAEGLIVSSRPGPQWNPWPSVKIGLKEEIDFLKSMLLPSRGGLVLENFHWDATNKEVKILKELIAALENLDRVRARRMADALEEKWPGFINNGLWAYLLDGRMARGAL